ncbi:isocitrate lyase/phosphoenolpyruvate mutase family protein [Streptomyces sp. NPDC049967]|uniref:isocitrate lyase/PEP mutase family protein n=1 Tax=Streptomyces sp. NPDC049967 TaxID=3155658 RepID=UPI0034127F9B
MTASELLALHHGRTPGDPLVLPGPWDAASARVFADAGFPALATPSAGVAASLGYEDGETPAEEMFAAVARIARAVAVPVSADIEAGYGLAPKELVERLLATGAVGCNLEDSLDGVLMEPDRQADRLAEVRAVAGDALFVNARVDTYVRGVPAGTDQEAETVRRALLYVAAGADCVYPIGAPAESLPRLAAAVTAPLNALSRPDGPGPRRLGELGAARITFGPGLQRRAMTAVRGIADELRDELPEA